MNISAGRERLQLSTNTTRAREAGILEILPVRELRARAQYVNAAHSITPLALLGVTTHVHPHPDGEHPVFDPLAQGIAKLFDSPITRFIVMTAAGIFLVVGGVMILF